MNEMEVVIVTAASGKVKNERITSTRTLRAFLVKSMNDVVAGTLDADRAKGVTNLAQQIYNTLNLELKVATAKAKYDKLQVDPVDFDG